MHISMLSTNIIFSTLDRLDRFVIQYNMVMNHLENYKFDYSVDFVRIKLGMLTTAIHIELLIISFSRWKVARFLSFPLYLDDTGTLTIKENLLTFEMRLKFKYSIYLKLFECFTF